MWTFLLVPGTITFFVSGKFVFILVILETCGVVACFFKRLRRDAPPEGCVTGGVTGLKAWALSKDSDALNLQSYLKCEYA